MSDVMKFKVILKEDELDGGFNVSCPALPGCHSQGESVEEALENIKDAIEGCLVALNKRVKREKKSDQVVEMVASWRN